MTRVETVFAPLPDRQSEHILDMPVLPRDEEPRRSRPRPARPRPQIQDVLESFQREWSCPVEWFCREILTPVF